MPTFMQADQGSAHLTELLGRCGTGSSVFSTGLERRAPPRARPDGLHERREFARDRKTFSRRSPRYWRAL